MLLEYDMIEPSKSPWACGVVMAKKKGGQLRFCCELGLYQWKRMPLGLCNATATFQRLMAQALTGVTKKYGNLVMCYVDDVVIATPTLEDHIDRLDEVFGCMKRAGLKCKPSKCEILRDSIKYLGRMVDRHGVRPDPEAVEAVLTWKAPRTDTQLLSFLGFANYYREFIKGYADKVYPMQKLMRNKGKTFGEKTGFACELGLYQWKRMPFGLCNATATFQRLMAQALTGVTKKYGNLVMCYVDDVVIATPTLEDHIDRLDEVFGCMKRAGLKCKPSKCEILRDSIKYLGRMVDRHGVRPDPEAVEAVLTWKAPRTDTQLLSFLGFANYYREFIKGYADKVYPMQKLMRNKGKKFGEKTGFACELGLYQWNRMPFGLCNATATFQRLMAQALTGVTKKYGTS